jgi:putative hydroxymethylpyrimidine transport system substrate-binding protein
VRRPLPALVAILAALATAVALGACGEKKDAVVTPPLQSVRVMLDYFPNADHAPLYAAQGEGYFRQSGLTVKLESPSDPAAPLKLLAAGKVDLAISYEPEVLLARDKGLGVVSVGALVQKPLTSLMALGSANIHKPRDLEGKRVGTAGIPYQTAYLDTILKRAGVDPGRVQRINVRDNLETAMLSGQVDATLGAFWNYEGVSLKRKGKDPTIIRVDRVGVPTYDELVFVAREKDLGATGERVRRFLQAVSRGARAVRTDARTGIDPLLKANPDLDRGLQAASLRVTAPLFFPRNRDRPFGWQDERAWAAYSAWMTSQRLVKQPPSPRSLTNEFLPGEGL